MPLTEFQIFILSLLAKNRNPDSYVAGGIVIHRNSTSVRYSDDVDFFHESIESVERCSQADIAELIKAGLKVEIQISRLGFVRISATNIKNNLSLRLEWVTDSAFRFFPVEKDQILGYRLHDADIAVNKCLALAGRSEARDLIDILQIDKKYLCLGAMVWAASGKDPGLTPPLILEQMNRNAIISPNMIEAENLVDKPDLKKIKIEWLSILESARDFIDQLSSEDLGCLYLNRNGEIVHTPQISDLKGYIRHFGSVKGSWPKITT